MNIKIRDAVPSDSKYCTPLIHETSEDFFDFIFKFGEDGNENVLKFIEYAFKKRLGILSYKYTRVAELDGQVVGIERTLSAEQYKNQTYWMYWYILKYFKCNLFKLWKIHKRSQIMDKFIPNPPNDALLLFNLAVAEEHRGKKIGKMLIQESIKRARDAGKDLILDVSVENKNAQIVYDKSGFREEIKNSFPELEKENNIHGMIRMRNSIN